MNRGDGRGSIVDIGFHQVAERQWRGRHFDANLRCSSPGTRWSARWGRRPSPDGVSAAEKPRRCGRRRDGRTDRRTVERRFEAFLRAGMAALGAEYSFNSRCQEGGWCLGVEGRASLSSDEKNEKKGGLARKCRRMQEGGRSGPRRFVLSKKSDDDGGRQLATGGVLWSFATPGMGAMSGNGNLDAHRSASVTIRGPTKQSNFPGRV